jgi:CBS domain-containing protein
MLTTTQSLLALTASDLMSRPVVVLPQHLSLRAAARLLFTAQLSGAPVVDAAGRCVGVLSTSDFVRWAAARDKGSAAQKVRQVQGCSFQIKTRTPSGKEVVLCALPAGACPMQVPRPGPGGKEVLVCNEPHGVSTDWQTVELEELPADEVRNHMTADPVTVPPSTPLSELARMMVDAHIHRLIVVDPEDRPVGIISSTDILAAVARVASAQTVAASQ